MLIIIIVNYKFKIEENIIKKYNIETVRYCCVPTKKKQNQTGK